MKQNDMKITELTPNHLPFRTPSIHADGVMIIRSERQLDKYTDWMIVKYGDILLQKVDCIPMDTYETTDDAYMMCVEDNNKKKKTPEYIHQERMQKWNN